MTANIAAADSIAQQYGVPAGIWQDVAYTESGFNPTGIGDNGSSFGLFQLHAGGQADQALAQGYTTQDLLDPNINAKFAMPAIAQAWQNLQSSFDPSSASWWQSFAAQSGHPGGAPGNSVTNTEAARLQTNYGSVCNPNNIGLLPGLGCSPINQAGSAAAQSVDSATQLFGQFQSVASAAPAALIQVGIFVAAIVLMSAGFFLVANGGSENGS